MHNKWIGVIILYKLQMFIHVFSFYALIAVYANAGYVDIRKLTLN